MELTQRRAPSTGWQKWSASRRGTIAIALVAAIIAGGILVYALSKYRHNVNTADRPATVLVAGKFIAKGTAGAAIGVGQWATPTKVLQKQLTAGAIADPGLLHGQVAAVDIYPGQQLTASDFVGGGLLESRLPRGERAISVVLDQSHGMVGSLHTGNRVDVYVSFPATSSASKIASVRLLSSDVVVLSAGQAQSKVGLLTSSSSQSASVVLQMRSKKAAELAFAEDYGKVWLFLSPASGTRPGGEVVTEQSIVAETQPRAAQGGAK